MSNYVYLDNAATTKVLEEAIEVNDKYQRELFFNPSALYQNAINVARDIKSARQVIASVLGVDESTLVFVSSGSESDNQALLCSHKKHGSRVIISASEHSAVYNSAMELKQRGYDVCIAPTDSSGRVIESEFVALLNSDVSLVSIMHVNNVTGAINDIKRLVELTKAVAPNALFHSDGVQAFCKIPTKLRVLGVDLYSISSHKIGATKGSGLLYIRKGLSLSPLIYGGGQERGLRSSTENVPAIMAFAKATSIASKNMAKLNENCKPFFERLRERLSHLDDLRILTPENSAPHILALDFKNVRGEVLMHTLEGYGYITGIGSACSSKKGTQRLPDALGLKDGYQEGILRISCNAYDTYDADDFADKLLESYNILKKYTRV